MPATIITSDCLGEPLGAAPNLSRSYLGIAVCIISTAQQASPKVIQCNEPVLAQLIKFSNDIQQTLQKFYRTEVDVTQSIGKRYRRQDEIGTPYCVTIDFDSLEDSSVTIRNRDSMDQERIKIEDLLDYFSKI